LRAGRYGGTLAAWIHSFVAAHMTKHGEMPTIPAVQEAHREAFGTELPKTTA
jgi:hypothetical protein